MRSIPFVKMSGTGNDFMMIDNREGLLKEGEAPKLAQAACPRRTSAGADGIILVEKPSSSAHDYRMRTFNADGSEAEMCGNGSRCIAVFACQIGAVVRTLTAETSASRTPHDPLQITKTLACLSTGRTPPGNSRPTGSIPTRWSRIEYHPVHT